MSVHVVIDASNVLYAYNKGNLPRAAPNFFKTMDTAIMAEQSRGRCFAVLSSYEDLEPRYSDELDLHDLRARKYKMFAFGLDKRRVVCEHCHRGFLYRREKKVDSKVVELLFSTAVVARNGDTLALVSGDIDFEATVRSITNLFPRLCMQVWAWNRTISPKYRQRLGRNFQSLSRVLDLPDLAPEQALPNQVY